MQRSSIVSSWPKQRLLRKLKPNFFAIEAKHTEELAATRAVQEAEARAVEAKNSLARTTKSSPNAKKPLPIVSTHYLLLLAVHFF
jgi:hypothetical protein